MYESHWGLTRPPFGGELPTSGFLGSRSHQAALLKLRYLIETSKGAGLLAGQPGLGKTTVLEMLSRELQADENSKNSESGAARYRFVPVLFPQLTPSELLGYIASKLVHAATGDHRPVTADSSLQMIEQHLTALTAAGTKTILLFDDAQLIEDRRVFGVIQSLMNFSQPGKMELVTIFAGQLELVSAIKRMRPLDERMAFKCLLLPLSLEETTQYVTGRMAAAGCRANVFSTDALQAIHLLSSGVPRRINRLCDFALLVGYSENLARLTAEHIHAVAEEMLSAMAA